MKSEKRWAIILMMAMITLMMTSGTVFAKPKKHVPSQYQPIQNSGPGWQEPGKGGQDKKQKRDKKDYEIQEMRYSKGGNLQIKIKNPDNEDLRWNKNQKIVVRDSHGKMYNARVKNFDRNVLELIVANLVFGEKYSAEIYGLDERDRDYRLKADFWARNDWRSSQNYNERDIDIQRIWSDDSGRVRVTLNNSRGYNIRWNNRVRVTVRDSYGRSYNAKIIRAGQNTVELAIRGLRYGRTYRVEITGVGYDNRDRTIVTSFRTKDNWTY